MRKPRKTLLVTVSIGLHVAVLFAFVVSSIWKIEKLEAGTRPFDLAVAPEPQQEAGSPEGSPAPKFKQKRQHEKKDKEITHDITQPDKKPDEEAAAKAVSDVTTSMFGNGLGSGTGSGSGNGLGSGTGSGTGSGSGCVGPDCGCVGPECGDDCVVLGTCPPITLPPTVLRGLRTSGETQIHPDDVTKTEIIRSGKTKVVASFRVCIGKHGEVSSMQLAKPSGFAGYDSALTAGMRSWTYKPYLLKDAKTGEEHPIPVCGIVTFIYAMQ